MAIVVILVSIVIVYFAATCFKTAAEDKGYDGSFYFWLCFLLAAVGWPVVIALPDKKLQEQQRQTNELLKQLAEKNIAAPAHNTAKNSANHSAFLNIDLPDL